MTPQLSEELTSVGSNRSKKLTAVIERLGCSVPKAVWHRNVCKACYSASPFYPVSELRLRQLFLQGDSNSARFLRICQGHLLNFNSCCPSPFITPKLYRFSGQSTTRPVLESVLNAPMWKSIPKRKTWGLRTKVGSKITSGIGKVFLLRVIS